MVTIGSLFSGIGLLELGLSWALEEAGIPHRVAWQIELDPFCREVLERRYPGADRSVSDVRAASSLVLAPVDILIGGFPCQDVSGAGDGAGLDGERSGLWFELRRLIDELRPRVVLIENVASGMRRWLGQVRCALEQLGYQVVAFRVRASDVGAPHRRSRIFVAYGTNSGGAAGRVGPERPSLAVAVKLWTTPMARDAIGPTGKGRRSANLTTQAAPEGSLNPTWVEQLMGAPLAGG